MMKRTIKKAFFYFSIAVFLFSGHSAQAQDLNFNEHIRQLIERGNKQDTLPASKRQHIQKKTSAEPDTLRTKEILPTENIQKKDTLPIIHHTIKRQPLRMSEEALYWSRYKTEPQPIPYHYTFKDTMIVNPLFMPLLFKKENLIRPKTIVFYQPKDLQEQTLIKPLYVPLQPFEKLERMLIIKDYAYRYVRRYHPDFFRYSVENLPIEKIQRIWMKEDVQVPVHKIETSVDDYETPPKFIPDRRYWTSSFESSLRFSQNYISPNWYKVGTSNLNILTKNLIQYNYNRDKIQFKNLLQFDVSAFTASDDTLRNYNFGDNLFRIYSILGYKAFSKWFYTIDGEFKAPLFNNYTKNTKKKQVAFLSPYIINFGLGMKYDLIRKNKRKRRSFTLSVNVAPISYTYMRSMDNAINRGAHGFPKDEAGKYKNSLSKLGSTVRMDMTWKANRNVTWKSRLYYNTTYKNVLAEFENSLDLAISRYFSTLINIHLRFDDSVKKTKGYDSYIQTNEVLSFGFSYKW